jgi:hypothetical protein
VATSRQGGSRWSSERDDYGEDYRDDDRERSSSRGGNRGFARDGVRVHPDMSSPGVARITIEINYDELISRVIKKMGETIRTRQTGRRGSGAAGKARSRSKSRTRSKS